MPQLRNIPLTFTGHLQNVHYNRLEIDQPELVSILDRFRQLGNMPFGLMPAFYIIDYGQHDYVMMSEGIRQASGYWPQDFMEGGLGLLLDIYQKEDFKVYNEKIFTANKQFLSSVPPAERSSYIFTYTFRIRNASGSAIQIYQRGSYLTAADGTPLYSMGMVMNVTGMLDVRKMFHSIEKIAGNGLAMPHIIQQNIFYPYEEDTLLTMRELDILSHMADGLGIKQIADRLRIAENTVANHRKNMLEKTNTQNMAELVAYAFRNNILR